MIHDAQDTAVGALVGGGVVRRLAHTRRHSTWFMNVKDKRGEFLCKIQATGWNALYHGILELQVLIVIIV